VDGAGRDRPADYSRRVESGDASPADRTGGPTDGGALLEAAVRAVGGQPRPGQQAMAAAVEEAAATGEHLLVQAGTGTGKSLAYLVPAIAHAVATHRPVVVSTATLALQAQIVDRDLPRIAAALEPLLGRRISWQLVKGRGNYVCLHKATGGFPSDDDVLFDLRPQAPAAPAPEPSGPVGRFGREVARLREWAQETASGDRDELVPGVSDRAWRQVAVSARECLGGQRCPQAGECFSELARERAHEVDVVVTNHAFVAIDTFEGRRMLPEHDLLVLDEGHEFADRVTSVISDELSEGIVEAAARRVRQAGVSDDGRLDDAGALLAAALAEAPEGRLALGLPEELAAAAAGLRDAARDALTALKADGGGQAGQGGADGARQAARAAVTEVHGVAERLASGAAGAQGPDVAWVSRIRRPDGGTRTALHVAPLSVAGLLRERLYDDRAVILTSATLALGGSFEPAAGSVGLLGENAPAWRGLDVGSPFDYPRQGILYVARHLPAPGRDGVSAAALDELAALVEAAGGRTLGLFSSRRAAELAAEQLRERLDVPVLCQGEDSTPTLVREFARDARTCLFGTLSLWQGVDVPGSACQLVVIDRIPFPRPDDPLASARQQAVARSGGNGFMTVAATHAALRLAQGVGRLVRSGGDRGVVAVLDSRLATARYGAFLRASLPPFWTTESREAVLDALRRIDAGAAPPLPVREAAARAASGG
jgi:ATP-dependent DNA helicase DinG